MKRTFVRKVVVAIFLILPLLLVLPRGVAQNKYFADWPEGADPKIVGDRVAQRFLESPHQEAVVMYPEVCIWYGSLAYADVVGDAALRREIACPLSAASHARRQAADPGQRALDYEIFGVVPLQMSIENKDEELRKMGLHYADRQWSHPLPDGLSGQTRYWIDDMFMITILQVEAYRATGDRKYIDRAANEMVAYLKKLQQPNGLFYHAEDVPFYWGRGNGWVAAGMTEMLLSLPQDNPNRAADSGRLSQDDGGTPEVPGIGWHVETTHRSPRILD